MLARASNNLLELPSILIKKKKKIEIENKYINK
jgi:hypothetical protein